MGLSLEQHLAPRARKWKPYVCEPFEIIPTRNTAWGEPAPTILITDDACAGKTIILICTHSIDHTFNILLGPPDSGGITVTDGVTAYLDLNDTPNEYFPLAEGVYVKFGSFSGAYDLEVFDSITINVPDKDDSRWKRTYFGGYMTYMDIPCQPGDSVVSEPIPFMSSPGQAWTFIYNVHANLIFGSSHDLTGNFYTDIRLASTGIGGQTIVSDEFTWSTNPATDLRDGTWDLRQATTLDNILYPAPSVTVNKGPLVSIIDKSMDGTGLLSTDTDRPDSLIDTGRTWDISGHSGLQSERVFLHFSDSSLSTEGIIANNQFVAIMIIPM